MITLNAAYARMKRQKIEEFAGNHYLHRDDILSKIPKLRPVNDQQFLFGIYSSEEKWTVLSVNFIYACYDKKLSMLQLDIQTDQIYGYFSENDFAADVHLSDGRSFWLKSSDFSQLFLNIILMLKKVPCGVLLE